MRRTPPSRAVLGASALLIAAFAAVLTYWSAGRQGGSAEGGPPTPVSSVATARRGCLLTDNRTDPVTGGRVWTALRQAAAHDPHLIAQRFVLPPAATPGGYLDTLTHMHCTTVVAVSPALRGAVLEAAGEPGQTSHFLLITEEPTGTGRVATLSPDGATASAIAEAVGAQP
ncbi:hypothetical protein ACL02U_15145 [Streptomyces sp. MS06]|uniref:hypothetical protein n=1 Tax=Streptomyces sp. MS06 TaxID=3385974 RepID=UPI00399FB12B